MRNHLALAVLAGTATFAAAISAHFIRADGTVDANGTLVVNFKEAGLGNDTLVEYLLSTSADATYRCYNNGSNAPQGEPYELPDQALTATGTFSSGKNGSITASLEAGPPNPAPADAVLKCLGTGNKKLCLLHVSYSDTVLKDMTFNVETPVTPNPVERSFPEPTKQRPNPPNCQTSL